MLDEPREAYNNKKLHGKFRATDIRWEIETTKIDRILLRPNQPPMYITFKYPHVPYHREHLQVVKKEKKPPKEMSNKFIVEKILDKKKEKGKVYYLIKWKKYNKKHNSWEPRTELIKDVPELIKAYEN